MDELLGKLSSILNTKEGQEQLKNIQSVLSQGNNAQNNTAQNQPSNGGFDLSSLASMLSNNNSNGQNQTAQQPTNGGFDMSALASMLGGLGGGNSSGENQAPPQNSSGFDMSALTSMLGGLSGGNNNGSGGFDASGIDINMILKLQQVFAGLNKNDKNTQLLMALKPHFSEKRCAKVDQAISMMRLFSMLPLLKESGIFAGL